MRSPQETTLDVVGMRCRACTRHVDRALRRIPGVDDVDVDLESGAVRVRHDPEAAPVARLTAALAEAGYDASACAAP